MIAFADELFDGQLLRTVGHCTYGGAELGECLAAAAEVGGADRERWLQAWTRLAERTLDAAESSLRGGHRVSARGAFLRASNYFRNAYVFHLEAPLPDQAREAYRRHRAAFAQAARLFDAPLEPLAIPFEGGALPGYFCPAEVEGPAPLVVSVGGYDSTAEESYFFNAAAANARGFHAVIFDGPGQGGPLLEHGLTFRPDWETVLSAVLDAVAERPEVDAARIALIGESFGGYLAPRGATDPRVAACVLDPAQLDLFQAALARLPIPERLKAQLPDGPRWLLPPLRALLARVARKPTAGWALRRGMLTHGVATAWDYLCELRRYRQQDLVGRVRCPTLVCDAEADPISRQARAFYEALRCEKTYLRFATAEGSGEHCVSGNRAVLHARVFDWLEAVLAAPQPGRAIPRAPRTDAHAPA